MQLPTSAIQGCTLGPTTPQLSSLVVLRVVSSSQLSFKLVVLRVVLGPQMVSLRFPFSLPLAGVPLVGLAFFFNGGKESPLAGEDRKLIPSPQVATYDLQPEMSAPALADALVEAIHSGQYPLIVCNVANPDMVGHSGDFEAAVKAVEAVDELLGKVVKALERTGGELLLTADHGNVEQMQDASTGQAHTAHTSNPVPAVYLGRDCRMKAEGSLRDIAPTILTLMGLKIPDAMTGQNLIDLTS